MPPRRATTLMLGLWLVMLGFSVHPATADLGIVRYLLGFVTGVWFGYLIGRPKETTEES